MGWVTWSLAALIGWGAWAVLNKRALRGVGWEHLLIASWLAYTAALLVIFIFRVDPRPLVSRDGAIAVAAAISAVIAEITFFLALRSGPVATVTPLSSLYPAVTVVLAVALLRESPSALQWAGVAVAILAGILLTRS
jgi:drug/metabolite transporter (DMT)-like permease